MRIRLSPFRWEMFTVVVYGQLILEQCELRNPDSDVVNQIFDFMVRDFSRFALQIYGMDSTKEERRVYSREIMLITSQGDSAQHDRDWKKYVAPLSGEYEMNQ